MTESELLAGSTSTVPFWRRPPHFEHVMSPEGSAIITRNGTPGFYRDPWAGVGTGGKDIRGFIGPGGAARPHSSALLRRDNDRSLLVDRSRPVARGGAPEGRWPAAIRTGWATP